jgi:glycosyltransferase involved in cell wall biosynthesis
MPVARYALQVNAATRILDVDTSLSFWAFESLGEQTGSLSRSHHWVSWQKSYSYERRWLSRFALGTLVSPIEISYLQRMVRANGVAIEVLPNGVDCDHNRPGLAQPQPSALVYNGSLTYSANYDAMQWFLAEIYPRIRSQQPDVTLTITGSTKGVAVAGLALDDSVRLTGFVEDVRIPVAQATVCVVPIRQGGGTRLKILEAMALGTPVVATSKGAEGLEVTPGHDILIADEPAEFAEQVIRLLRDSTLRKHLAWNARRLMEMRYDWQGIGRSFVHLVEESVAKRAMTDKRP